MTLIWDAAGSGTAHEAVSQGWLKVTVLANARTGLRRADEFYFASAIGEAGVAGRFTTPDDVAATIAAAAGPAGASSPYDHNRDGHVSLADAFVSANHIWTGLFALDLRLASGGVFYVPWFGAGEATLRAQAEAQLLAALANGPFRITGISLQPGSQLRLDYRLPFGLGARLAGKPISPLPVRGLPLPEFPPCPGFPQAKISSPSRGPWSGNISTASNCSRSLKRRASISYRLFPPDILSGKPDRRKE